MFSDISSSMSSCEKSEIPSSTVFVSVGTTRFDKLIDAMTTEEILEVGG
jgi:hypothetical protein